jgi:pyruvate/2-oxoglutarate dehydrogenase complex dihydrolipoamide dehydrogenase (E3) component
MARRLDEFATRRRKKRVRHPWRRVASREATPPSRLGTHKSPIEGAGVSENAEVIVIGMGPGGEDAAERLAEAGLDVIGIDAELVGGECPYWGCIPSKMIIRAANLLGEAGRIPGMAGAAEVRSEWAPVARRIRDEATDNWDDAVAVKRFEDKGGRMLRGWAHLVGETRVAVGDRTLEASRALVIAAGTRAWIPPIEGLAGTPFWTNRQAIATEEVPRSLAVIGGGAIGVELAQAFSRFGSKVTVIESAPSLVGAEEPEAGTLLAEVFGADGVDVLTDTAVSGIRHDGRGFAITLGDGRVVDAERLLVAVGRRADLAQLKTAAIGVDEGGHGLPVDDHLRVPGTDHVWAIGDITGKGAFTHMSMYQADIVVNDILGNEVVAADYRAVPRVTFTDPEIGSVGITERDARAKGLRVRVGSAPMPESARGWIHKAGNQGFIKLVEDADRGILVGATSAGPAGGEVLGLLTLAVYAEVPTARLRHMIYAYPTFHRAVESALANLGD